MRARAAHGLWLKGPSPTDDGRNPCAAVVAGWWQVPGVGGAATCPAYLEVGHVLDELNAELARVAPVEKAADEPRRLLDQVDEILRLGKVEAPVGQLEGQRARKRVARE